MPKRTDIKKILLIGSGPIVIGQACEFDYSGTQAIKALKEEGFEVVLVNSNPATIMTDPEFADRTYIEPISAQVIEKIIEKERPDALLPTMGGQTALNVSLELFENGILEKYDCQMIGADVDAIKTAEDRELFREAMNEIGLKSAKSGIARSIAQAKEIAEEIGYPIILRPSRTLGGSGGGIAHSADELPRMVGHALSSSPNGEVLLEKSLIGWKEFELEVMRDLKDNVVIICSIENLDPMGVHTGDSITVAPVQTLTDKEYQVLRTASIDVIRKIGVETGGSNVQFAMNPDSGEVIIIEMNPRVSRSSALASKATGFPIAKMAAKLAVGYTLDEIQNDITKETPACFEPTIDYTVVKIPRFNFEKFPMAEDTLGTQMKSVGEVLAFGRSFSEALQKAICSMELDSHGFDRKKLVEGLGTSELLEACKRPSANRLWLVAEALRQGSSIEKLHQATGIDRWFLAEMSEIVSQEELYRGKSVDEISVDALRKLKREGFSDIRLASLFQCSEAEVREARRTAGVVPAFFSVDTCSAEFCASTPYMYSTYESASDNETTAKRKIMILGSGPNRIGQGIEFDYCCVHAVFALQEDGFEAIMVNCNPETVSTDYDISDRLYFEPLTLESVLAVVEREMPEGVIVQFGGQTPLKMAADLERLGVPIIGTPVHAIDAAEDREKFSALVKELGFRQPEFATARSLEEAEAAAGRIGFPLMIRPSFVLGGRAMRTVFSLDDLRNYMHESVDVSHERPVLLDRFLQGAIEVDVDAISDGKKVLIAGVMEHIERAGIHSGDSSCCLPPPSLSAAVVEELKRQAVALAERLGVCGLMNVQFAVDRNDNVYILEANPRASRTVPFVSKATGVPWAKIAARVMAGKTLDELAIKEVKVDQYHSIKACVFPFNKFSGVDTILGPEMKSTGEVMGIHESFGGGFAKAQLASNNILPSSGRVFLSVADGDKEELPALGKQLVSLGFQLVATEGTAQFLKSRGVEAERVNKVREGSPHIVDRLGAGEIQMVVNTPEGQGTFLDSRSIRLVANEMKIPTFTTVAAAGAAVSALGQMKQDKELEVCALQDYHSRL